MVWVRLNLNPHHLKAEGAAPKSLVCISKWVVNPKKLGWDFARGFVRGQDSTREGARIVRTNDEGVQITDEA
jgi:hypothetical protein